MLPSIYGEPMNERLQNALLLTGGGYKPFHSQGRVQRRVKNTQSELPSDTNTGVVSWIFKRQAQKASERGDPVQKNRSNVFILGQMLGFWLHP